MILWESVGYHILGIMRLPTTLVLLLSSCCLATGNPTGNQADINRPFLLDAWQYRVDANHGVHAWNRSNDGMRVFQEWITLLTKARSGTKEQQRQVGLALQAYVVGGNIGPLGFIGTSLPVPGYDQGDFDMSLLGCSSLLGLFIEDPLLLTDATLIHLLQKVVRTWGQIPKAYFDVLFVSVPETENHLFMTESTRFLTNQILYENSRHLTKLKTLRDSLVSAGFVLDNQEGMLKQLLLKAMQKSMCKGFFEFNAQIYQRFTIHALDNLYSFAHDSAINNGAACLLDYLATVFAFQSIGSIRYGPYRRSSEVFLDSVLMANDAAGSFFAVQSGAFSSCVGLRRDFWKTQIAHASMGLYSTVLKYRVPDPILNFMQNRIGEYRAEMRSAYAGEGNREQLTEVYHGSQNFLLTAGGRYENSIGPNFPTLQNWFGAAPWVYDVITRSSTLLLNPEKENPRVLLDILHFRGSQWRANNLAIYRNFLYGYTAVDTYKSAEWPQHVPDKWFKAGETLITYTTRDFDFRFVNRSTSGVYIVLGRLRSSNTFLHWRYQKFLRGTIEVVDTSRVASVSALKDSILKLNTSKNYWTLGRHRYVYVNFDGARIHLNPRYDDERDGIVMVEEKEQAYDTLSANIVLPFQWPASVDFPLFQVNFYTPWKGNAAVSDGKGNMYVFNPSTGGYLMENFNEWWNPRRKLGVGSDSSSGLTHPF